MDTKPELEAHRAVVREYHLKAQRAYGFPGLLVALASLVPLGVAQAMGQLGSVLPWVLAPTLFLCGMLCVRGIVRRRIATLSQQLAQYCQTNRIDLGALGHYYTKEHADYPFFDVLMPGAKEAP